MAQEKHLHAGHRERLRERFLKLPESLADHELLELLLFYVLPRQDTNDLAHALIEEFGSFHRVLEADAVHLQRVAGVGPSVAAYIKALGAAANRYEADKFKDADASQVFDTPARIARFLWPHFLGQRTERVYAMLFDNGMRLLDLLHVCDGSVSGAPFSVRRIVERAYMKGATGVILAHNHPGGLAVPSGDDISTTRSLDGALRMMEIPLIEHYVFSDREFMPIMSRCRVGEEQQYAASSLLDIMKTRLSSAFPWPDNEGGICDE